MYGEKRNFPFGTVTVQLRLLHRPFNGNDYISDDGASVRLVCIPFRVVLGENGKRENVRRGVLASVFAVQLPYSFIVRKGDGNLGGKRKIFAFQRLTYRKAYQFFPFIRHGELFLIVLKIYLVMISHFCSPPLFLTLNFSGGLFVSRSYLS